MVTVTPARHAQCRTHELNLVQAFLTVFTQPWPVGPKDKRRELRLRRHGSIKLPTERVSRAVASTRVELREDPEAAELSQAFLWLVPPARRQHEGAFGMNLFRAFTKVVTKPHCDNEEFIAFS